jgi:hypothetical protein
MLRIKRSLGYRLVLQKAVLPVKVKKGTVVPIVLTMQNYGYAAPFNPRPVVLLLRNQRDSTIYAIPLNTNVRKWFSGAITISENIRIPAGIPSGNWELLLSLPDAAASLKSNPAYSVRLANTGLWEEATGYNNLHHVITIP